MESVPGRERNDALAWNADKRYLQELAAAGVRYPPPSRRRASH
jgi:hypothetical protein